MNDPVAYTRNAQGWLGTGASVLALLAATSTAAAADEAPAATGASSSAAVPTVAPSSSGAPLLAPSATSGTATLPQSNCPPATADVPMVDSWYGWQTLAFDGAALAMFATLVAANPADGSTTAEALGYGAGATYLLGAPAVHLAHEHVGKALASAGLRAGLPLATALIGGFYASGSPGSRRDEGSFGDAWLGVLVGTAVGAVGASVLDATFIAHERVPVSPRATVGAATSWAPAISVLPHGGTIGIQGTLF